MRFNDLSKNPFSFLHYKKQNKLFCFHSLSSLFWTFSLLFVWLSLFIFPIQIVEWQIWKSISDITQSKSITTSSHFKWCQALNVLQFTKEKESAFQKNKIYCQEEWTSNWSPVDSEGTAGKFSTLKLINIYNKLSGSPSWSCGNLSSRSKNASWFM